MSPVLFNARRSLAPRRAIILLLFIALAFTAMSPAAPLEHQEGDPCGIATNGIPEVPIEVDGEFGPPWGASPPGEWEEVAPLFFYSDGVNAARVCDPADANSVLWVAVAFGVGPEEEDELELYLMYEYYLGADPSELDPGETVAVIQFPVNLPEELGGGKSPIGVIVSVAEQEEPPQGTQVEHEFDSFFDVFVDLDLDGVGDGTPAELGLDIGAAAGFGGSPVNEDPHLLAELEVSLRIPREFGDGFPGDGINPETGLYDPDPVFWGGSFAGNGDGQDFPSGIALFAPPRRIMGSHSTSNLEPGTAAIFQINPDGSTTADSTFIPEPFNAFDAKSSVLLKLFSLLDDEELSDKTVRRVDKAIERIVDSLESLEEDGMHVADEDVFDDERKAVKELLKILDDEDSGLDVTQWWELVECVDILVEADRNLALMAIAEAQARFGDAGDLEKAAKELAKGDADAAEGKLDKAVKHYRKAWKAAEKA